ncbi:GAF domain-containing protein [Mycolicibacterium baixiangningiae]|uniref:GAF domain-containing protein n=1 Tax=Mycolicibacterium baixiangningiae TaxID=2761578 RepID=UPI0018D14AB2|nr:GAF domain-containing protein [Mycolicibacterium baixiangningiae]
MQDFERRLLEAVGDARGLKAADRLCEACVGLLDVDAAAVSIVFDGANMGTYGASGPQARKYDELQFIVGEGPCLDSVANRAPVMVADLADPVENRWPAYGPVMIDYRIRGVYAIPVVVAGTYMGALDFFRAIPDSLATEQIAGMVIAAELAQLPLLDLLKGDLQTAVADPGSDAWAELNEFSRTEVSQATGMLMAQLNIDAASALARLRARAYASGRTASAVARDIIDRRLQMEAD